MMRRRKQQQGLAVVEFTLTLPFLLFLMLATAEVGRIFVQYSRLSHAVRNSVRYVAERALLGTTGVVNLSTTLQAEARNLVVYGNAAGSGTPVVPGLAAGQVTVSNLGGGNVAVQVAYPYQSLLGGSIPTFGFGQGDVGTVLTLTVRTTMRAL